MKENSILRKKLDVFLSPENEQNWWKPDLFEKYVRHQLPRELKVLAPPPEEPVNYNCFVYALGLQNDPSFLGNVNWDFTKQLDRSYEQLIAQKILLQTEAPSPGDLIVYRADDGTISHVGLMDSDRKVTSKWSWGPLLRHAVLDVPVLYGDDIKFYKMNDDVKRFVIEQRKCLKQ